MTKDDARAWLSSRYSTRDVARLSDYCGLLIAANDQQNLVAPSTVRSIWSRHIVDSAQLIDLAPSDWQHWIDVGSGAGLPGIVVGILTGRRVTLVEPRRLRVEFLAECCKTLGLATVTVLAAKAQTAEIADHADVVSARAVAKLDQLFSACSRFSTKQTTYVLPKGSSAKSEVATARRSWQGMFHVEQSIVDPDSGIVVAQGVTLR